MSIISNRLKSIKPSPTLSVVQAANEIKAKGIDIISLGAGEPDFDTSKNIKNAAIDAINAGHTKYTNVNGTSELIKAIQNKFKRENNIEYNANEIIVSTGAKQVIYNLFMASINNGDEVIIPAPYWVSYPDVVLLAGGVPMIVQCPVSQNFKLTKEILSNAITPRTKWLILNSPSNPTGAAYLLHELNDIAQVLRQNPHVHVMSDDIYEHIIFDGFKFHTIAEIAPDLKDRIFTINGVSKAYAMTGWRIGYGAGSSDLIKAMSMIQSQSTSNACSISQMAAIEAINGNQDFIIANAITFQKRRDLALSILNDIPGITCYKPEGAFYLFPKCKDLFGRVTPSGNKIANSNDLAKYLLEYANVAVVPGVAFGLEGHFRISYATSLDIIEESCRRISKACSQLKRD